MTGREALASLTALYDIAGQIRATLVELQAELRLAQEPAHAQSR
jgi:ABC-type Na+ transport system ATPase subunit NatA